MNEHTPPEQQQDLFDSHVQFTPASKGSRFLNLLIDNLFMNYALSYATGLLIGWILSEVAPELLLSFTNEEDSGVILISLIISIFNYLLYYTICEKAFNGYTLGKIITGTKAIRLDGQALTFRDAFLRSLSRLVPFEPFSGFGDAPWHDTWTKTTVIKVR